MTNTTKLAQMLDPLLQDLLHPDSTDLGKALKLLFGSLEARANTNHDNGGQNGAYTSDQLFAFGTAYARCIISAHTNASIYGAVLRRSGKLVTPDPGSQSAFSRLCGLIVGEINRDLGDSHAIIAAEAKMLGLSAQERADIEHIYRSGALFEPLPEGFANKAEALPDFSPANITNLVLALTVALDK